MKFEDLTKGRLLFALKKSQVNWNTVDSVYTFLDEEDELQEEMADWLEENPNRDADEIWHKIGELIGAYDDVVQEKMSNNEKGEIAL